MSGPTDPNMIPNLFAAGCAAWSEDLKAYLDQELPTARRRAIEEHLQSCDACRKELRIMQQIQEELRADEGAQTATLDPALKARILESAEAPALPAGPTNWETEVQTARTGPKYKPRTYWMEYGLLASLVLLMTIGTMTLMGGRIKNTFNTAAGSINTATDDDDGLSTMHLEANRRATGGAGRDEMANSPVAGSPGQYSRHLDGSNYAFADGHVKWLQSTKDGVRGAARSSGSNFTFGDDDDDPTSPETSVSVSRKVHREASLGVAVKDVEASSDAVESRVKEAGGYVVNTTLTTGENNLKTAVLELKVPVGRFDALLRQIGGLGSVVAKDISGQDITEKYVAANARRNVLGDELAIREAQLRVLEKRNRRADAERKWELTAEVRRLRIVAAESKARLAWLRKTADLSDMTVTLEQQKPVVAPAGFWQEAGNTGKDAWASFAQAARIPVTALIWIIAYCPFWIPALILLRKYGGFGEKRSVQ